LTLHIGGMNARPATLSEWPLWRLIVELHDVERFYGADSPTARILASTIQKRLLDANENAHADNEAKRCEV